MNKSEKVLLLSNIILTGFFVAVAFHYILGFYMGAHYSFNTFLSDPKVAFDDFTGILPKIKDFMPYVPPANWQNYFPLAYLILFPFTYIKNKFLAYFLFASIFIAFFSFMNTKAFAVKNFSKLQNFQNIFILTFLSYPFLYLLDRGNIDMVIFILFAVFVWLFQSKKYQAAAILLGVINAFKPYSFLFFLMFLFEKKYREFFLSLGTAFLLIVGGFMLFKGGVFSQFLVMLESITWAQKLYTSSFSTGTSNCSSLFIALKFLFCSFNNLISVYALIKIYNVISVLMTAVTVFFAWKEKIFWKRLALLTFQMVTIPFIAFDYKLIFLFVPLALFVNQREKSKFDLVYTILFGLLLIPKRYILFFGGIHKINFVLFSIVANPLIMILFMALIIFEQFYIKKRGNEK